MKKSDLYSFAVIVAVGSWFDCKNPSNTFVGKPSGPDAFAQLLWEPVHRRSDI